jgi:hypothetical protein
VKRRNESWERNNHIYRQLNYACATIKSDNYDARSHFDIIISLKKRLFLPVIPIFGRFIDYTYVYSYYRPLVNKSLKLLRAGSRKQASLRKTDAAGVRENPSSGPAKPGQPLWVPN